MKILKTALIVVAVSALASCSSGWKCTKHYGAAPQPKIERKLPSRLS